MPGDRTAGSRPRESRAEASESRSHDRSEAGPSELSATCRIARVPIDHVNLPVSDLDASRAVYTAALAPFGYRLVYDTEPSLGFGRGDGPVVLDELSEPSVLVLTDGGLEGQGGPGHGVDLFDLPR